MSKFKSVKKILGGVGVCVVLTACETANSCARSAPDVAANKAYGTGSEKVFFSSSDVCYCSIGYCADRWLQD